MSSPRYPFLTTGSITSRDLPTHINCTLDRINKHSAARRRASTGKISFVNYLIPEASFWILSLSQINDEVSRSLQSRLGFYIDPRGNTRNASDTTSAYQPKPSDHTSGDRPVSGRPKPQSYPRRMRESRDLYLYPSSISKDKNLFDVTASV